MSDSTKDGGHRGALGAAVGAIALLLVGVVALVAGVRGTDGPPQPLAVPPAATSTSATPTASPTAAATSRTPSATPSRAPAATQPARPKPAQPQQSRQKTGAFLPRSAPAVLDIPSIGVRSKSFVDLEVAKDGTLEVPGEADEVGIYTGGPTPGQLGPAVLGAHVDSKEGPGIFYDLGSVKPGDKVHITRQDGIVTTFVVDRVAVFPKDDFPTEQIYHSDFTKSEIRLVTCGGTFDRVKHYLDNVVVFGHLVKAA